MVILNDLCGKHLRAFTLLPILFQTIKKVEYLQCQRNTAKENLVRCGKKTLETYPYDFIFPPIPDLYFK